MSNISDISKRKPKRSGRPKDDGTASEAFGTIGDFHTPDNLPADNPDILMPNVNPMSETYGDEWYPEHEAETSATDDKTPDLLAEMDEAEAKGTVDKDSPIMSRWD